MLGLLTYSTDDARPFAAVLRDFVHLHGGNPHAASKILRGEGKSPTRQAVDKWLAGQPCPHERAYRALMDRIADEANYPTAARARRSVRT